MTNMKTLLSILLFMNSVAQADWHIVFRQGEVPNYSFCAEKIKVEQKKDSLEIYGIYDPNETSYSYAAYQFFDLNQGNICHHQNSSNILGGMICISTTQKGNLYESRRCETMFGSFRCNAKSAKNYTSAEFKNDSISIRHKSPAAKNMHDEINTVCTYKE